MLYFIKYTFASSSIVGCLESFQTDRRNKVLDTKHFLAELFINQSTIVKERNSQSGCISQILIRSFLRTSGSPPV